MAVNLTIMYTYSTIPLGYPSAIQCRVSAGLKIFSVFS